MAGGRYDKLGEEELALHDSWDDVVRVSLLVGLLAVLVWAVSAGMRWTVHHGTQLLFQFSEEQGVLGAAALLSLLALGGGIRAVLIRRFGWGDAAGDGMSVALENYHITYEHAGDDPQPRFERPAFSLAGRKIIMTLLTLLSGASGGLEAPIVLIAESIGAGWARIMRTVSEHELRTYQLAAISAGVASLLGAPFAAALFATEIAYADRIVYRKFAYALFAGIVAYILNNHVAGFDPLFVAPPHDRVYTLTEYGISTLVAVAVSAPIALGFGFLMTKTQDMGRLGGKGGFAVVGPVVAGVVALVLFYVVGMDLHHTLGVGEHTITEILHADLHSDSNVTVWWFLLIALGGRMLTTGLTIQSGGSAGLLIPSMFLGGIGGAVIAQLISATGLFGVIDPAPFVVSGIASSLVAVVGVPLAAIALVLEVFGAQYGPPAILACGLTYVLTLRFSVYRTQRMSANPEADETGGVQMGAKE